MNKQKLLDFLETYAELCVATCGEHGPRLFDVAPMERLLNSSMSEYCPAGCSEQTCKSLYIQYNALWQACGSAQCRAQVYQSYIAAVDLACGA